MCWSQREFYSYKGLEPVKGVISVGACLNHCSAMDSCNTVDFDPASKEALCWVQKVEEINKDNFVESKTASNFLLNRECLALFDDDAVYNTGNLLFLAIPDFNLFYQQIFGRHVFSEFIFFRNYH